MNSNNNKPKITSKQVVAMGGVILLALLYIITLVVAFVDQTATGSLFQVCLVATIAVPLLIWVYIWMYCKLTNKKTMADLNIGGNEEEKE